MRPSVSALVRMESRMRRAARSTWTIEGLKSHAGPNATGMKTYSQMIYQQHKSKAGLESLTSAAFQRTAQCSRHSPSSHAATGMPIESLGDAPCWICRMGSLRAIAPPCTCIRMETQTSIRLRRKCMHVTRSLPGTEHAWRDKQLASRVFQSLYKVRINI